MPVVLILTIFTHLLSVYSVTLKYSFYIGQSDLLFHLRASRYVYENGEAFHGLIRSYQSFPLFHVAIASFAKVFGISVELAWAITSPIIFSATIFLTYCIAQYFFKDAKYGLYSATIYSLLPTVVFYNQYFVTRVAGFVAFAFIFYFSIRSRSDLRFLPISIVMALYMLLVHQVSYPQAMVIFTLFVLSAGFVRGRINKRTTYFLTTLAILFIGYWVFVANQFTEFLILTRVQGVMSPTSTTLPEVGSDFHHPGYYTYIYILATLSLVSVHYLLRDTTKGPLRGLGIFMLLLAPLYIPNPLHTFWITRDLFRVDRFALLLSPILAILLATGIQIGVGALKDSRFRPIPACIVILLIFTSITAGTAAPVAADVDQFSWTGPRAHLTESEESALTYADQSLPIDDQVLADRDSARYLNEYRTGTEPDSMRNRANIFTRNLTSARDSPILLRSDQFETGGITVGKGIKFAVDHSNYPYFQRNLSMSRTKVYDSGTVQIYG
ncbi:hypothetical protein [Salinarchaeum laminariae]|uniref:hypothetical protein n=1 Tax=Salinarchaeum laminariae TaxID=869888 RepID=UPI0020BF021A|nr:hypothetical protein [Salinarchaeum laminariae]